MLKVLVDNGIVSASDFVDGAKQQHTLIWGERPTTVELVGFQRIPPDPDSDIQVQKDALFTVGRLVREQYLGLYTYSELRAEQWRRNRGRDHAGNAFRGCAWSDCDAALDRSTFFRGLSADAFIAKGGRKDRKVNNPNLSVSQIAFCKLLLQLSSTAVERLIAIGPPIVRTKFEEESLRNIDWFRRAVQVAPSEENYPDFFHLWTAKRNSIDIFLTLEKNLPRYASDLKRLGLLGCLEVLRPTELASKCGVSELDPVPLEAGRFYSFADLMGNPFVGWK